MRHFALQAALAGLVLASAGPAAAEVRFGNNVFIGGHNFSHKTYNRHHRLHVMRYDHPIRGAGCVTRGAVRTCRLQRIPH
jgi:hypothetical protein